MVKWIPLLIGNEQSSFPSEYTLVFHLFMLCLIRPLILSVNSTILVVDTIYEWGTILYAFLWFKFVFLFLQFCNMHLYIANLSFVPLPFPSRHKMFLRDLNQICIERDIVETSQKHLKRDDFFETPLRRLKYISKKMSFLWRL